MLTLDQNNRLNALRNQIKFLLNQRTDTVGKVWGDSWQFLQYIFDLGNANLEFIRMHASMMSEQRPLSYWGIPPEADPFKSIEFLAYKNYTDQIDKEYWLSEPFNAALPKQHGIDIGGPIINRDIVRYQSTLSNLVSCGVLAILKQQAAIKHVVVMEIGSGYGGLAFQLKKRVENSTFFLVDLPQSLFMAGVFLIVNNPEATIYIYHEETFAALITSGEYQNYDFILVPDWVIQQLQGLGIDLFVNMLSFQEMPEPVVRNYLQFAQDNCHGFLYSANFSKYLLNQQLHRSIEALVAEFFRIAPELDEYETKHMADLIGQHDSRFTKVLIGRSKKWPMEYTLNGYIRVADGKESIEIKHVSI